MTSRIYLAAPYSHPEYKVRAQRYLYATQAANRLMRRGLLVYSPVTHGHTIGLWGGLNGDFEAWREHCLSFLRNWAQELYVLTLPGWKESIGVAAEIAEAESLGLPVGYVAHVLCAPKRGAEREA
jgi:hypothetical protein